MSKTLAKKVNVATLQAELKQEMANINDMVGQSGGTKMKVEPNGDFVLPDGSNLGNEVDVVVVDFVSYNRYYVGRYDPNDIKPPVCFAVGKLMSEIAPSKNAPEPQNDLCSTCTMNQFGSDANGGPGKACKNTRDLVVIVSDDLENPEAPLYTFSVAPTSIKMFDAFVKHVHRTLDLPPIGAIVKMVGIPSGTYAKVNFTEADANPLLDAHLQRRAEAQELLYREPDLSNYQPATAARRPRR